MPPVKTGHLLDIHILFLEVIKDIRKSLERKEVSGAHILRALYSE